MYPWPWKSVRRGYGINQVVKDLELGGFVDHGSGYTVFVSSPSNIWASMVTISDTDLLIPPLKNMPQTLQVN